MNRYERQMKLPEFGLPVQERLAKARVLVVGAGGLGCPALLWLTAAGVGKLVVVDDDAVDLSNLQRQVLYTEADVGKPKALAAALRLKERNGTIEVTGISERITAANAVQYLEAADLVIDGSDNFETRYMLDDACRLLNKPLVYGSVFRFEGQVALFHVKDDSGISVSYRDLFPDMRSAAQALDCADAGAYGLLTGLVGMWMANEALKYIGKFGTVMAGKLLLIQTLSGMQEQFQLYPQFHPDAPPTLDAFAKMDYAAACRLQSGYPELEPEQLMHWLAQEEVTLIDVREWQEEPWEIDYPANRIPLSELNPKAPIWQSTGKVIVVCETGKRSLQAITGMANPDNLISLKGGIRAWRAMMKLTNSTHG